MSFLEVAHLKTYFPSRRPFLGSAPPPVKAVDDVSFLIEKGSTVGLVGESGSGKSTLGKALLKLVPATAGQVMYGGKDILGLSEADFRPLRRNLQMVFQDPYSSLNPRMTVAKILAEPMELHLEISRGERRERSAALLEKVGLPGGALDRFPHEFSGGQRQRLGIARALAVEPEFLVLDEPVSALDVSVQAQIVNLLQDLQEELGLTYLFIGHDLAVVEHLSDHILVMFRGKIVEAAPTEALYRNPQHAYTRQLLEAAA
jgi:peptide/nickel transport system ATP-binding protein/oligopeptide transport system ATP-binding protein